MSLNATTDAPYVETPTDIIFDRVNLMASHTIAATAYGIVVTLFGICARLLIINRKKIGIRWAAFHLSYSSAMLVLGTLYVSSGARTVQLAYVDHREFSQGAEAYTEFIFSQPITILGSAPFIMSSWFMNAFLIWRCAVIYQGTRHMHMKMIVIAFSCLLFIASIVMGIFTLVQSSRPNQSFWSTGTVNFGLAYFSISTALTVLATTLILARIIMFKRQPKKALGPTPGHGGDHTSIAGMLVESAATYAVCCTLFVILYGVNSPVQFVFLASAAEVQVLSPFLIILRIAGGRAWESPTSTTIRSNPQAKWSPTGKTLNTTRGGSSSATRATDLRVNRGPHSKTFELSTFERTSERSESLDD